MKKNNWFDSGRKLNWSKDDGQSRRRESALKARRGNYLKTARALQSLANVTTDDETRRKAHADAQYFFRMYRMSKKK